MRSCPIVPQTCVKFCSWQAIMDLPMNSTNPSLFASSECDFNDLQMCFTLLSSGVVGWVDLGWGQMVAFAVPQHKPLCRITLWWNSAEGVFLHCITMKWGWDRAIKACLESPSSQRQHIVLKFQCFSSIVRFNLQRGERHSWFSAASFFRGIFFVYSVRKTVDLYRCSSAWTALSTFKTFFQRMNNISVLQFHSCSTWCAQVLPNCSKNCIYLLFKRCRT